MIRLTCLALCFLIGVVNVSSWLIVPQSGPTRHQLIIGIGIPVDLEVESVTWGFVAKAQYKMPEHPNEQKFTFFPGIWEEYDRDFLVDEVLHNFPNGRRRREALRESTESSLNSNVERLSPLANDTIIWKGDNEVKTREEDDEFDDQFDEDLWDKKTRKSQHKEADDDAEKKDEFDLSTSRWVAYDALSSTLESKGFDGRTCVLRGICEAADVQFSEHLMSELFHIFFTPSTTAEPVSKSSDYDYIKAEEIGRDRNAPDCQEIFHQCKRSIMEIFTEVYDNKLFQF